MLKLLRKIIGLLVKLVLLPFRLVLRLAGLRSDSDGGSSVASAAASASAAAAASAAGTAEDRREAEESTATPVQVDDATRTNYERFRKTLYAYAGLGALSIVAATIVGGNIGGGLPVALLLSIALPAGLGYWARAGTKGAWGAGMAYAAIALVLALLSASALFSLLGRMDPAVVGSTAGTLRLIALLGLVQAGVLVVALYFGATGRGVALSEGRLVDPGIEEPASSPAAETTADEGSTGTDASEPDPSPTSTAAAGASGSPTDGAASTTATDEPTADTQSSTDAQPTTDAQPSTAGAADSGRTAESGGTQPAAAGAADAERTTEPSEAPDESGDDPDPEPEETGPAVADLAERAASARDPAAIRELGDQVAAEPVPDEVVAALEDCADADDPDVRVAVCEACAAIDAEETDDVLGRLRIDTNDRVATAAMEAY